jgi:hypothetical protein
MGWYTTVRGPHVAREEFYSLRRHFWDIIKTLPFFIEAAVAQAV